MHKYKIVGAINLLFGIFQAIISLFTIFVVLPRLTEMYSELNVQETSLTPTYLILGFVLLVGVGNLFFGFNLVSKSEKKEKYFKYALALIIASCLLGGLFISIASLSTIIPIYRLYSQF